jgi:serralysin
VDRGIDTVSYAGALGSVRADLGLGYGNGGEALGDRFSGVENLTGSAYADQLAGDAGANSLIGDAGNDVLSGRDGSDTLDGSLGDDMLSGGNGGDKLIGGAGLDLADYGTSALAVVASLSNTYLNSGDAAGDSYNSIEGLNGSAYADRLSGDDSANVLLGNAGNDTLSGGYDGDVLQGGFGNDQFVFDAWFSSINYVDQIVDFESGGKDKIVLSLGIFGYIPKGELSANAFSATKSAMDADDRILFDPETHTLSYDRDGTGAEAAVIFVKLLGPSTVNYSDILVV